MIKNPRHIALIGYLVLFQILLLSLEAFTADQDVFDIYSLEIEGVIYGFLLGDFDGDEKSDIAIIYSTFSDLETRYIGLFIQQGSSGFSERPDYLTKFAATVAHVNAGDLNNDGRDELILIGSDGIYLVQFSSGTGFSQPVLIVRQKTVYSCPFFFGIITDPFLFELNSNPGPEMVVPVGSGYIVFEKTEDGNYSILNQLLVPIAGHNSTRSIKEFGRKAASGFRIDLARVIVTDGNLDERPDIYFLWDRKVCCFFQDATGNFPQTPDTRVDFYPQTTGGFIQSHLIDVNGDRRPDIVVSRTSGGITNTETKVRVYMSSSYGQVEQNFSKEITLSDSHCNLMLDDFNGDNIIDLALPAIELGAMAATKMFLFKKTDLHILIYPFKSGVPSDEPAKRMQFEFRFNFDDPQPTGEVTVDWSGDYNGDDLNDLAFCDGKGKVNLFWGRDHDYLPKKSDLEISLDRPSQIYPVHLNNGRYSDIIVEHRLTGKMNRLTIMKNRNNGN